MPSEKNELLTYQTDDGKISVEVRVEDGTIWLTQAQMAVLFQTTKQNVSLHIKSRFSEKDLSNEAVARKLQTILPNGKKFTKTFYSLDVILSVGYHRRKSCIVHFHRWVNGVLRKDSKTNAAGSPQAQDPQAPQDPQDPQTALPIWHYLTPLTEVDIKNDGYLLRWMPDSVWHLITYRLVDALPDADVENLMRERERWKKARGPETLKTLTPEELAEYHKLFFERYENLLAGGGGSCWLRDSENAGIVADAFRFFENKRHALDAFVVMPNHVHVLVKPFPGHRLARLLRSWKNFTSVKINQRVGRMNTAWEEGELAHIVPDEQALEAIRRYIREEQAKAGPKVAPAASATATPATPATRKQNSREPRAPRKQRPQQPPNPQDPDSLSWDQVPWEMEIPASVRATLGAPSANPQNPPISKPPALKVDFDLDTLGGYY